MNQELSLHPSRCASPPSRRTTSRRACSPPAPSQTQTTFTSQNSPRVNASRITHSGIVAQTQTAFGAIRAELARFGGTLARIVATVIIILLVLFLLPLCFGGMLARFNVDDKGTILFAAFGTLPSPPRMTRPAPPLPTHQLWLLETGPPPHQHEDDASRAVLCAMETLERLRSLGHEVRCCSPGAASRPPLTNSPRRSALPRSGSASPLAPCFVARWATPSGASTLSTARRSTWRRGS